MTEIDAEETLTYEQLLNEGREKHRSAMIATSERMHLARACNGREDCTSGFHLSCCLTRKKPIRERIRFE